MLNALVAYAQTHVPFSEPGFTDRMIRWRIELSADGRLIGVLPQGEDDKGQEKWGCPEMHNMQAGGNAPFMVDNLKAAILYLGRNPTAAELEKAPPRHEFYRARVAEACEKALVLKPLALNRRGRYLADSRVLHWYKSTVPDEDDLLAWIPEPERVQAATASMKAKELLSAIRAGQRPDLGNSLYYACTLSGMSGRVMVRDWMEGQFATLVEAIGAWFDDLEIVSRDGKGTARDPTFMAVCGALVRDLKDLPAPTATTLWRVAMQRLSIPQPLMAQAFARFRTDIVRDEPFNHARMGLLRAYFVRNQPGGDQFMTAYLNREHPDSAYHCGRLLAVLANLQRAALGDVGAGVVQRYYASASQTPGLILGRLATNARNHLGKLDAGLAWWYEQQIAEVMSRLGDRAPHILDLEGQGLFALGYYQQLAAFRAGTTKSDSTDTTNDPGENT